MKKSDFSKCRMINIIETQNKVLAITFTSLYNKCSDIIILVYNPFENTNNYLCSTN